jgi:hypothetical protein
MKRLLSVPLVFLLMNVYQPSCAWSAESSTFNLFSQRKIIIGSLENTGEPQYGYLAESLQDQIFLLISDAPFIALTDQERDFLLTLSLREEYEETFAASGRTIRYRLEPIVTKGEVVDGDTPPGAVRMEEYPLYVYGSYEVHAIEENDDHILRLLIHVRNLMTDREDETIELEGGLSRFIDTPRNFLFPLLPEFLRYTIYRANFTAEPPEALIFVDDRLTGIGEARDILVTPGLHRVVVREDGYQEYRDLVQITEDGFARHVTLQREQHLIRYLVTSTPDGAQVYLDEKYKGETPLSIVVDPSVRTITLSKEGYRTESVAVRDLPPAGGGLQFGLIEAGVDEELRQKAERHKRGGKYLSWAGLGVLGTSILFGVMSTLKAQESDLYQASDPARSEDARSASNLYTTLLYSSLILAGGIFTFSFIETVQYFKTYNRIAEYEQIPLVSTEVAF